MSRIGRVGGWAIVVAVSLLAATAGAAEGDEAVLAVQDRRFALTAGGDLDELERLMTDDMTYTHSSAVIETRAEFLESLRSGRVRYVSIEPEERAVRIYGDAAVVQGVAHVEVEVPDRDIDVRLRFTELYVKRDGAWKMALWHSTAVP